MNKNGTHTRQSGIQTLRLFDADAMSEAVRSSKFEHVQLEAGDFRAELKRLELDRITIDSGCYTRKVLARGDFPTSRIVIGCLLDSREEGLINGYRFSRNDIIIYPKGSHLDYLQPAYTTWCAIQVSQQHLEDAGFPETGIDRVRILTGYQPIVQAMRYLMTDVATIRKHHSKDQSSRTIPPCEEQLLELINHTLISSRVSETCIRRPSLHNRMALLRKFEQKLLERIDGTVRINELCTELHVTARTLEHLVKTEYGMTPKQFHTVLRLNAARQDLLKSRASNETVSEIARRNGIHHLGRFSANYTNHFGEYPSETLRRQLGREGNQG